MGKSQAEIQYDGLGSPLLPWGIYKIRRKKVWGFGFHYGIYLSQLFHVGPVVVDLNDERNLKAIYFREWLHGKRTWWLCGYCPQDQVQAAIARLWIAVQTNTGYDLLKSNCEHFANWVVDGEARSFEVEKRMRQVRGMAQLALMQLIRQLPRLV